MPQKATNDDYSIFISYKEIEGGVLASFLKRKLKENKLDAFVARDDLPVTVLPRTDEHKRRIHEALEVCIYIVVLLTSNIESDEVIHELDYALGLLKKNREKYFLLCRHESVRQNFLTFARKLGFNPDEYTQIRYRKEDELARKLLKQFHLKGWLKSKSDAKKNAMNLSQKKCRVLVIGDVMLDHVIYGHKAEFKEVLKHGLNEVYLQESLLRDEKEGLIRPKESSSETFSPGGAAWLAMSLSQVAEVTLFGLLGSRRTPGSQLAKSSTEPDFEGRRLIEFLTGKVNFKPLLTNEAPTICKNYCFYEFRGEPARYSGIRIDREDGKVVEKEVKESLKDIITKTIKSLISDQHPDAIVIDDYEKGMVTPTVMKEIASAAQDIPLFIDPKYKWDKFKSIKVQAFLPNTKEALFGIRLDDGRITHFIEDRKPGLTDNDFKKEIMKYNIKGLLNENCDEVVMKADQHGSIVLVRGTDDTVDQWFINPLVPARPAMGVGCGGIFDGFYIASRIAGNDPLASAILANFAAGIRARYQLGKPISANEVKREIDANPLYFKEAFHAA